MTNHPRSHLTQVDVGRRMPNDVRPFHVGISRDSISQSEPRIYNATLIQRLDFAEIVHNAAVKHEILGHDLLYFPKFNWNDTVVLSLF